MSAPVFISSTESLQPLNVGEQFTLEGSEAVHAAAAMRVRPGDQIDLVDGAGLRVHAQVTQAQRTGVSVTVLQISQQAAPQLGLVLIQALAKGGHDEQGIAAAVELGISAVHPWQAERSIVRWKGEKSAKGMLKLGELLRAASKQSRRSHIPELRELLLGAKDFSAVAQRYQLLVLDEQAEQQLSQLELHEWLEGEKPIAVVIGPEGGISENERQELAQQGAISVKLGEHILRSATAGPAAVATLNTLLQRW